MKRFFLIIYILFVSVQGAYCLGSDSLHTRLLLFSHVGQRETVRLGDKFVIIYGTNIKTDYTYLAYQPGTGWNNYTIELKSNEPFYREISGLKTSVDSLKNAVSDIMENRERAQKGALIKDSLIAAKSRDSLKALDKARIDSLLKANKSLSTDLSIFNLPKYQSYVDTIRKIMDYGSSKIAANKSIITNNNNLIDTIRKKIDFLNSKNDNREKISLFLSQIDSLIAYNFDLINQNKILEKNNTILEIELKNKDTRYNTLMKYLLLLLSMVVLIGVLSVIIFVNYRQKKRFNSELRKVNFLLNESNKLQIIKNRENERLLNTINKELNLAANYVLSLIPAPLNETKINTDWFYKPSKNLGGDAFGYHWIDDENFVFYFLDVSGHGVGPALHSVQALNILQNSALTGVDFKNPTDVLGAMNNIFRMELYNQFYFTMWYGVFNYRTRVLNYSGAGHPPMILVNSVNSKTIECQNIFIGAIKDFTFASDEMQISNHSSLYIFSDGAYEVEKHDRTMSTHKEFSEYLLENIKSVDNDLGLLYKHACVISRHKELDDDFTILKIDFL